MKYRIIGTLIVLFVLVVAYAVFSSGESDSLPDINSEQSL